METFISKVDIVKEASVMLREPRLVTVLGLGLGLSAW